VPYILKYVPYILKQVPCILKHLPYVFFEIRKHFSASRKQCAFLHEKQAGFLSFKTAFPTRIIPVFFSFAMSTIIIKFAFAIYPYMTNA